MTAFFKRLVERFRESKSKTTLVLTAIFFLLVAWGIVSWIGHSLDRKQEGFLEVSGRIEGYEYHASARIAGEVISTDVGEGDSLKAGQQVGRIRAKQLEALLQEMQARLKLAEVEYEHARRLTAKNAVAGIRLDQAEEAWRVAKEAANKAMADLEDAAVVSPTDGVVVTQVVRAGEVVAAGTPLVTIVNPDDLYLKVFLSTDVAGQVKLRDEARIFPDAFPDEGFDADVTFIADKAQFTPKHVETKSQRAKLVFEIRLKVKENAARKLKAGMPADGVIKLERDVPWKKYRR